MHMIRTLALLALTSPGLSALPLQAQCGAPGVTVAVSPASAVPGQPIQVTLSNNSSQIITLGTACLFRTVHSNSTCNGLQVLAIPCLLLATQVAPGQTYSQIWDQKNSNGQQVLPGTYSFPILYSTPSTGFSCCATATIAPGVGAAFCIGNQGCPCGNDDSSDSAGCVNSSGFGASLSGTGTTSVANDDLVLTATGCPPGNSGLYFVGPVASLPVLVGDGQACTGGLFRYLPGSVNSAGVFTLRTPVASAPPGLILAGDTRHFQAWTRDVLCGPPPAPCPTPCGGGSNLSSGFAVSFSP